MDAQLFILLSVDEGRLTGDEIKYSGRGEIEDKECSMTDMSKNIILGTMTGLGTYLEFTMETSADFDGWLPTCL